MGRIEAIALALVAVLRNHRHGGVGPVSQGACGQKAGLLRLRLEPGLPGVPREAVASPIVPEGLVTFARAHEGVVAVLVHDKAAHGALCIGVAKRDPQPTEEGDAEKLGVPRVSPVLWPRELGEERTGAFEGDKFQVGQAVQRDVKAARDMTVHDQESVQVAKRKHELKPTANTSHRKKVKRSTSRGRRSIIRRSKM